jgi:anti-sigma regulatory factor (Ser/Thr protein kinase)
VTTARISLPAGTMAVPAARRFTSDSLRAWGLAERTMEIAELVVSELVGNAIEHGGGMAELALSLRDDVLRVDVVDHNADVPVVLSPEPVEDRHRGLLIVSALSAKWGTDRIGSGKSVWAELTRERSAEHAPDTLASDTIAPDTVAPEPTQAAADGRSLSG